MLDRRVHHAVAEASVSGAALTDLLLKDEQISSSVSAPELRAALDPANYTGRSAVMAREMAAAARVAAAELQHPVTGNP